MWGGDIWSGRNSVALLSESTGKEKGDCSFRDPAGSILEMIPVGQDTEFT